MVVLSILVLWVLLTICAAGVASGSVNWKCEDEAYQEHRQHTRAVREVLHKEPAPLHPKESIPTVDEKSQTPPASKDLGETKLVYDVMVKKVLFCRQDDSADEALRTMRRHNVPYLLVLDDNLRIVGTVWMVDLMKQSGNDPELKG
jgi:CBS domain